MYKSLLLRQFRSYQEYSLNLGHGVTIVVGPNGSGKTNLLEALYVLSTGSSFRAADRELLRRGSDWFRLEGIWGEQKRILTLKVNGEKLEKQFNLDGVKRVRLSTEMRVPVVLFEPDHLRLLKASPSGRRDYLDLVLAKLQPDFMWLKHQFERVLQQRNAVLKRRLPPGQLEDQLFAWDVRFAALSAQLVERRCELINLFDTHLGEIYSNIARGAHKLAVRYKNSVPAADYKAALMQQLAANTRRDSERGFTTVGPQRDDFEVLLNDAPSPAVASRGETRSIFLALKIYELQMLHKSLGVRPLLLLDDVFSELDSSRCQALAQVARDYQTVITTTDRDAAGQYFFENYSVVERG